MNKKKLQNFYAYIYERFLDLHPQFQNVQHTWDVALNNEDLNLLEFVTSEDQIYSILIMDEYSVWLFMYKGANTTRLMKLRVGEENVYVPPIKN